MDQVPEQSSQTARAIGRVAGRTLRGNRYVDAAIGAFERTGRRLWRVMHTLLLEIAGIFFLLFVVIGAVATYREYMSYAAGKISWGRPVLSACFTTVFVYFSVSSFWRARRKRK